MIKISKLNDTGVVRKVLRGSFFLIFILVVPLAYNYYAILADFKGNTFDLLHKNCSASGLAIEGAAADFETDLVFFLANSSLVSLVENREPDRDAMVLLERFYSKYSYFIAGIRMTGPERRRDFQLNNSNYFSSAIIESHSGDQNDEIFWNDKKDRATIVYTRDIIQKGQSAGQIHFLLDIRGLVHRELSKYYTMSNSWYWFISRDGSVLSALYSESAVSSSSVEASLLDEVVGDIRQNYEGTLEHAMTGAKASELLTAYSPITVFNQRYGVLFSVDKEAALHAVTYRTVIIIFCFVLMILLVGLFFLFIIGEQKRTEKLLVQAKGALEEKVKERTAELMESEEKYRLLFEKSEDPMMILTRRRITMANKAVAKALGYSAPEEIIGKMITDYSPEMQPDGVNSVEKAFAMEAIAQASGFYRFEWILIKQDDSEIPIDVSLTKIPYRNTEALFCVFRDLSELKETEKQKRKLENQLQQSQKMEALGLMAGGVAHDLNNILAGIVGYPELMIRQLPDDSALIKPLNAIFDSGKRASVIVADLLTISKDAASATEVMNLNTLVMEYLESPEFYKLRSNHPSVEFRTDLASERADISCSPVHVKKCIMNLISNAAEAIEEKGHILISSRDLDAKQYKELPSNLKPGKYVMLQIKDTGHGIPAESLRHIFEPFYSKKVMGRSGTGLGLTVVWKTMNDHNGTVIVDSGDNGTVFKLYFPVSTKIAGAQSISADFSTLQVGAGEKILVVDDEPNLRDIACQMLEALGYQAEAVESGEEAVELLKHRDFELLIMDMLMEPGISGYKAYEKIVEFKPSQKAIIASGFSINRDVEATLRLGAGDFIKKPYTIEQIGSSVKRVLGK